jgi:hypothetical protein
MTPDRIWRQLGCRSDRRSLYSYLDRLKKEGLLERTPNSAAWAEGSRELSPRPIATRIRAAGLNCFYVRTSGHDSFQMICFQWFPTARHFPMCDNPSSSVRDRNRTQTHHDVALRQPYLQSALAEAANQACRRTRSSARPSGGVLISARDWSHRRSRRRYRDLDHVVANRIQNELADGVQVQLAHNVAAVSFSSFEA